MTKEHFDVLIVGAGLSGIGAAVHLKQNCPGRSFAILEGRSRPGGTWDLFRYPGVRSDSDMHTLGYDFKPWRASKSIADGPAILNYIKDGRKFYVVAAAGLLPILNYHMNKIMNKADAILDDDLNKIGKFFPGIKPKISSMKKADLKNSICLIASVNSHITTRKITNVLIDKQAGIILLPAITF